MFICLLKVKMNFLIFLAVVASSTAFNLYESEKEIRVYEDKIFIRTPKIIVVFEKCKDEDKSLQVTIKYLNEMVEKIEIDKNMNVKKLFVLKKSDMPNESSNKEENFKIQDSFSNENKIGPRMIEQYVKGISTEGDALRKSSLRNSQMVVLSNIFKKYEGIIGETTFKRLLNDVMSEVKKGNLHPVILDILKDLEIDSEQTMKEEQNTSKELKKDDKEKDQQQKLDLSGLHNNVKEENKLDSEVERQIQWIQQLVKQRSDPTDEFKSSGSNEAVTDSYKKMFVRFI